MAAVSVPMPTVRCRQRQRASAGTGHRRCPGEIVIGLPGARGGGSDRRHGAARLSTLSDDEIRRLSARLTAHAKQHRLQVAVIRLLLLTGCRKGEILTLRWSDYRDGRLFLRDSQTGPRTVWLFGQGRSECPRTEEPMDIPGIRGEPASERIPAGQRLAQGLHWRGSARPSASSSTSGCAPWSRAGERGR